MQYGAMNSPVNSLPEEIDAIGSLGFDYLELTMDAPCAHYREVRRTQGEIKERLQRYNMDLVCHLPTFVSTADLTPGILSASRREVLRSLETAAELQPLKTVLHPSAITGLGSLVPEMAIALAQESLVLFARRAGQLGLRLCLENMFPRLGFMVEPGEFLRCIAPFPELCMTLDVGHAFIGAVGAQRVLAFIAQLGPRIDHLHVSDNWGKHDEHLPIGKGDIPYRKIVAALKQTGFNQTVTLEIFTPNRQDLVASRQAFQAFFLNIEPPICNRNTHA